MYTVSQFVKDVGVIQFYFAEEDRVIREFGIEALSDTLIIEAYVALIASQFSEGEDIKNVEKAIWWFITDNDFGRANLAECEDEGWKGYGAVPDVPSLYSMLTFT